MMNSRRSAVLVAAALLLLGSGPLAGSAAAAPAQHTARAQHTERAQHTARAQHTERAHTARAQHAPAHRAAPTASVVLERSGGLLGATEVFTAAPGADRWSARLMRLTSGPRFRSLHAAYPAEDTCCDRYRYRLVVRYADGSGKTVSTIDGAPDAPWVLREVIDLTEQVGTPVAG